MDSTDDTRDPDAILRLPALYETRHMVGGCLWFTLQYTTAVQP